MVVINCWWNIVVVFVLVLFGFGRKVVSCLKVLIDLVVWTLC